MLSILNNDEIKTQVDAVSYDCYGYQLPDFADANNLYSAYLKARKSSAWKRQVQMAEHEYLLTIAKLQAELASGTYKTQKGRTFEIRERGKTRVIRSNTFRDRIVRRALCDQILNPTLQKYLIYDNGASIKGKGISFTRRRFEEHIHKFYRKHGNHGYILLMDFSKYYDNIRHDKVMEQVAKHIHNKPTLDLIREVLSAFEIDVSFLSDEQFKHCLEYKFSAKKYWKLPHDCFTGQKMMAKSLGIGDQVSQILSVFFPTRIDNFVKIRLGEKYYDRYMDDAALISDSKEHLWQVLDQIKQICSELGIFINEKKTHIMRLDKGFTWLQTRYRLTDSGHLIKRINPKRITAERRRLKKLVYKVPKEDFEQQYRSWMQNYKKLLSPRTRRNLDGLYRRLLCKYDARRKTVKKSE